MQYSQKYPEEGVAPLKAEEPAIAYPRTYCASLARTGREITLRQQFDVHYNRWIAAPHLLLGCPLSHKWHTYKDYLAIKAMGKDAVPFILEQITSNNYMLMHLLPELTKMNLTVRPDADEAEIAKAWMQRLN